jgi:hypothetical protein
MRDRSQFLFHQFLQQDLIIPQIQLGADQDDRSIQTMMTNFLAPFCPNILEGIRIDQGETDEEDFSFWVGEWPQSIVVFLTGRVPQSEEIGLPIEHHFGSVVVEAGSEQDSMEIGQFESSHGYSHGWNVLAREGIRCVGHQHASLSDISGIRSFGFRLSNQ